MEHLNNSISAGERNSMFLSASTAIPRAQLSHVPEGRAKSRPHRQKQSRPQASVMAVPEGSSDSEGESHYCY